MQLLQLQSLTLPLLPKPLNLIPKLPLKTQRKPSPVLSCSPTDQELQVLEAAVLDSDEKSLPCVRTYENDSSRLALVGAVSFHQALTAAAADGGRAADEHLDSGIPAMVIETVFPARSDDHSTVSTRLFLPARKVSERAKKLRRSISEDMLLSTTSRNILAMTFRQVVLEQLWSFELVVFRPGSERNMEDLENPREQVPASFSLSSSDERAIAVLAEAICISALQSTERHFLDNILSKPSSNIFRWFRKPTRIASKDSSVIIYELFEDEIIENAKTLLEDFNSTKEGYKPKKTESKHHWWMLSGQTELEKIGGPQFSAWTREYVPAYRLQIDTDILKNIKFEGWKKSTNNVWEVLLTHSQMVGLAGILDLYYEDLYSLPNKQLSCGVVANFANLSNKKRRSSWLKMMSVSLASGVFLVIISALGQLGLPHLSKGGRYPVEHRPLPSSEVDCALIQSLDARELEEFGVSIVKKIKDAFGWAGDIRTETRIGAWTGELPSYLRMVGEADSNIEGISTAPSEKIDTDMRISAHDIASYQVVLSTDGKLVGFQPTSRVAVNRWAANPLAKELYGGRKLSPGFIEPGLKFHHPSELVVMELLMSENPDACFALARPFR
ncbi:uncharacterized protein LOC115992088 isoform X1 [Quercus lobata]|uniref:uncharacterized protein LOC115992088 isoform X1 n=1 Tax=Quercus lobata TaxID=97700 RepID=UPI00124906F1|nr:uncharacterized protein LOC115992088 isoform X1 [Quercus lobata]